MGEVRITINGKEIITQSGKTILEVVDENQIDKIPTLCHDKRIEPYTSCFLCVVEVEGVKKLIPSCSTPVQEGMAIHTDNKRIKSSRKTALELLFSNHYADCIGPCVDHCPAHVDAQGYIALIAAGKYRQAIKLVKENNPLPLSIGRICVRDCEAACRRKMVDKPVGINYLKRYIADLDSKDSWIPPVKRKNKKKVAIIGGGPGGLTCAYYLTLEGYLVTIFEKLPQLGGMLRYGIPEYRLPKKILDAEINWITNRGIEVKTDVEFGKDFHIESLRKEGFEAIFIGIGAHRASKMRVAGEDDTEGVISGINFLRDVINKGVPQLKGKVAIVGGGNTAIDAARTALRSGADNAKIVYRRSIHEMPAHHEEIEAAQKEGIEIHFLTLPKSIIKKNNRLSAIECLKMRLEEAEPGERPKPVPIPGSEFIMECDYLIGAIGQQVDSDNLNREKGLKLESWGTVIVDSGSMETSIPGVFAGGDVASGPDTAINAIAHGKNAAVSIDAYLKNGRAKRGNGNFLSLKKRFGEIPDREMAHVPKTHRTKMPELPMKLRMNTFDEVELGLTDKQSANESERCLECGCSEYYDCALRKHGDRFELDISDYIGETHKFLVDKRHPFITLDPNKCINCGRCIRTCSEIMKVASLGFVYRGFKAIVKPAMEKPLLETNCISCGNCIDACPTGAITEKFPFRILGTLPKENRETICNFCSIGCKVNYKVINNDIFYVSNSTEEIKNSHNKGYLCIKGRFGHRYLMNGKRIVQPLIKQNGNSSGVTLERAIKFSTERIKNIIDQYGPQSVAVFCSPKMSNEELYLIQKFARTGIQTNNISSFHTLLNGQEIIDLDKSFGITTSSACIDDIQKTDVLVVINSDLSEDNLIMELKIKEARKKGTKLVLINSSEIKLTKFADLWIDTKKGTNTILMNGIIHQVIKEDLVNHSFIQTKTTGYEELKDMVSGFTADEICSLTEINREKFTQLINLLKDPFSNIIFIYNADSGKEKAKNDLKSIGNFLLLSNRMAKKNNGLILLRDHSNSSGQADMGISPYHLPGYVKSFEKEEIEKIGKRWNANIEKVFKPVDLKEEFLNNRIKAILVFGEDPWIFPNIDRYFKGIEFSLVVDAFVTESVKKADVVLPAATVIGQHGTFTSCERRIQEVIPVINSNSPQGNWTIFNKLTETFTGNQGFTTREEIFKEICEVNRLYRDCSIGKLLKNPLNTGIFYTENKMANFVRIDYDFTTLDPVKPCFCYSEQYYENEIRNKL